MIEENEEQDKIIYKTSNKRVRKFRQARDAMGMRRRELYAHDDDWPHIKKLATFFVNQRGFNGGVE